MEMLFIIYICFFLGYSVQSIFGFAGAIATMLLATMFIDIKEIIYLTAFPSLIIGTIILYEARSFINFKNISMIIILTSIGTMIGSHILHLINPQHLLFILSIILISSALLGFLKIKINKLFSNIFIFSGAIVQGITSTGGPLNAMGLKDIYKNKDSFRVNITIISVLATIIRITQYQIQGTFDIMDYLEYWPIIPGAVLSSVIGIKIKNKMSHTSFAKYTSYIILISGFVFLYKSL